MHRSKAALPLAILLALVLNSLLFASDGLITTIAGDGAAVSKATGIPATSAQITGSAGICEDASGNLFIADSGNNRVVRVDAVFGILTLVAGNGTAASTGDGGLATAASLDGPAAVAVDSAGNLYIAESQGYRIRFVAAQSGIISTVAGIGTAGFSGDGGPATSAKLGAISGIALDPAGDLYIADLGNSRVRRVDAVSKVITTVAGDGTNAFTADGATAASASLAEPFSVAFDLSGGLLISEFGAYRVRRVDPVSGILTTVAGNGTAAFTGDGVLATSAGIGMPTGLSVDPSGNLFVGDGTGRVRRVDAVTGWITTVAGNGTGAQGEMASGGGGGIPCYSHVIGDNGPATSATLEAPFDVLLTSAGTLLISDELDCRVRQVDLPSPLAYTNTVFSTSATVLQSGQQALLTATVSPIGTTGVPTGTVQFVDESPAFGATAIGTAVLNGGTASMTMTSSQAGGVMAIYSGDSSFNGSGSPETGISLSSAAKTVATIALSASQSSATPGTTVVFTATVTAPAGATTAPTGPVLLHDGSTLVATANLSNGVATLPDTFTTSGSHSMTATYLGSNTYSQVTSASLTEAVAGSTSVSVTSGSPNAVYGTPILFTVSVIPSTATGTIQLTVDGSAISGTAPLVSGMAVVPVSALNAGTHTITASYSGDSNNSAATSAALTQTVAQATPTFTIASSLNPSTTGQAVTLTTTMTPASTGSGLGLTIGNPPANLQAVWSTDGTTLTTSTTTSNLSAGTHTVIGTWGGDANVAAGTSAVLTQTVQSTTVQTTTTLTTSPNPSVYGAAVTLTATVTPATATGQVLFAANGLPVGAANLVNGQAQVSVTTLAAGSNSLKAGYVGDANDAVSVSPVVTQIVTQVMSPSTVTLTSSANPSVAGQVLSLTAAVSPSTATGTFQFLDGATALGTVTIAGGSATLSISSLSVGTHSITASYGGDANDAGSTSAALTQTVTTPTSSVTLTSSQNPSTAGQFVTFFATVAPSAATGTVQFLDGSTAIGTVTIAAGSAALSLSNLSIGTHSITAVYSGDASFPTSMSAVLIQTISPVTTTVQPQGIITTLYGSTAGCAPGVTNCTISYPVVDGAGNIYFEDGYQILAMSPAGTVSTIAGTGQQGTSGDGGPALSATVGFASQIAVYGSRVCFADTVAYKIRCVDLGTGLIQGYGTGLSQSSGDGGNVSNASFGRLGGIAFDDAGNLYVSDNGANEVRRVDAVTGTITALASVSSPWSLYYYGGGVYAVATGTHEVQRIDLATGVDSNVVGAGWSGYEYLALDQSGDVFFSVAQEIQMMDPSGNVTSIANTRDWHGYGAANDIPATEAVFLSLNGLGWDPVAKRLLIADGTSLSQIFFTPPTATALSVSANPVVAGAQVTLQATVSPATATGNVRFYTDPPASNSVPIGSVPINNGVASITWPLPTSGASYYEMRAVYGGDANDNLSASDPIIVGVQAAGAAATTTSLTATPNPSVYGGPVTLTAVVSPAAATGSVQFYDGSFLLGSATLAGGQAQFVPTSLEPGLLQLRAVYQGSSAYVASGSAVVAQTVAKAPSSVSLTSSANPGALGQQVYFTATVSSSSATGIIQLLDGSTLLGTSALTSGSALFGLTTLAVGPHSITAVYSGDASRLASNSAVLTEIVNKTASSVLLASSLNPSSAGQNVTFTARLWPTAATGTVQFLDGSTSLGTANVSSGSAALLVSTLSAGAHSITAVYSGDANYATSSSAALTETVNQVASSVVLLSSLNPSSAGQSVTFTATLAPTTATGTVQFLDGATSLGTVTITGGSASLSLTTLAVGAHSITAVYSGDTNDATSTSAALVQTVNKTISTVALTSSPNPSTFAQSVSLSAAVSPGAATGTVQFLDGSTVLGSATITSGVATLSLTTFSVGAHSITAIYNGDANDATSTSTALSQTVNKVVSIVALATSPNPSTSGQSVTLSATVTPTAATGTVQFLDASTSLGTVTISGGAASLSLSSLSVGAHSITAVYSGDANDATSTSTVVTQTVNQVATSVALASSANPSTFGQSVRLAATVTPTTATGTVLFLDGSTALGTVTITGGAAALSLTTLAVGAHSITAIYSGDSNDATSASAVVSQTVNRIVSSVTLASFPNPSSIGSPVVLTAVVAPQSATGTVQFLDGATVLGTATVAAGGNAVLVVSSLSMGSHSLTAVYSGDANDAASTSATLSQTVNKIVPSVLLVSSLNPSTFGQVVTLSVNVTPTTATGTIQFLDGSTVLRTATLSGGAAGMALTTLAVGAHSLTAVYSGDGNDAASTSAVLTQSVNKIASSVALASSANPSTFGQSVTLAATVTPTTATGTVQFLDGSTLLGTVTVSGGSASLSLTTLAVGAHSLTAVYSGDANDSASTSPVLTETVGKVVSSVALSSSLNPSAFGQSVTLSAKVTPGQATGSIQFLDGSTVLGTATISGGAAALSLSALAAGSHSITAVYSGDSNDAASTSAALAQTVNKAATTVALASSKNPQASGSSVTFTATVSPSAATGSVEFLDGSAVLGTVALSGGSATFALSTLAVGAHSIKAVYSGDGNSLTGTSAVLTEDITGASCHVTYAVTNQWNVGFGTAVTIENTGTTAVNGWNLTWTWAGNQEITQSWNATYSQTGANAKLTNESYNAAIASGSTITGIGFNASYSGTNTSPTAFSLNGTLCK